MEEVVFHQEPSHEGLQPLPAEFLEHSKAFSEAEQLIINKPAKEEIPAKDKILQFPIPSSRLLKKNTEEMTTITARFFEAGLERAPEENDQLKEHIKKLSKLYQAAVKKIVL